MISDVLNADHRRIEAILGEAVVAARSANWHVYQARFDALRAALRKHIAYEENELFPRVVRVLGSDAVDRPLREEHRHLCAALDTLVEADRTADPEGWLALLEQMRALLREHHENELRICYPRLDRATPA